MGREPRREALPVGVGGDVAVLVRERQAAADHEHQIRSGMRVPQRRLSGRESEVLENGIGSVRLIDGSCERGHGQNVHRGRGEGADRNGRRIDRARRQRRVYAARQNARPDERAENQDPLLRGIKRVISALLSVSDCTVGRWTADILRSSGSGCNLIT